MNDEINFKWLVSKTDMVGPAPAHVGIKVVYDIDVGVGTIRIWEKEMLDLFSKYNKRVDSYGGRGWWMAKIRDNGIPCHVSQMERARLALALRTAYFNSPHVILVRELEEQVGSLKERNKELESRLKFAENTLEDIDNRDKLITKIVGGLLLLLVLISTSFIFWGW